MSQWVQMHPHKKHILVLIVIFLPYVHPLTNAPTALANQS
jgi:hypothetical protein